MTWETLPSLMLLADLPRLPSTSSKETLALFQRNSENLIDYVEVAVGDSQAWTLSHKPKKTSRTRV